MIPPVRRIPQVAKHGLEFEECSMTIKIRFMILTGILSLSAVLIMAFVSYQSSVNNAMAEAKYPGRLIFNFITSSQLYLENNKHPKIKSGFVLSHGVWEELQKKVPGYIFKQATVNPLYLPNKADQKELQLIDKFRRNSTLNNDEGIIKKNGEPFFYLATPIRVSEDCLECHGNPNNAPQEQVDLYGKENGYNWTVGDTISADIVYVPLKEPLQKARKNAFYLLLFSSVGIILVMLIVGFFFNHYVVRPVTMLESRATEISLGKNIDASIATNTKDEIGSLARAVDLLRISVKTMLKMHNR